MARTDHTRAVSPVVGVALLVALTVVLAAVVAALAFDIGAAIEEPTFDEEPDADIEIEDNGAHVLVTHAGGDDLDGERLRIEGVVGEFDGERFSEGDSQLFERDGDSTVRVVYETATGETVLAEE